MELMAAMAISSLLMLALITLFFTVKRVEKIHHELMSLLDNGRYAVYILREDLTHHTAHFSIYKKALYRQVGRQRRQVVSYNIDKLSINSKTITFWIHSDDKRLQRQWEFRL